MTVASTAKYQRICDAILDYKHANDGRLPYVRELAPLCGQAPGYLSILLTFMEARGLVKRVPTTRKVYVDVVDAAS